jgi:hypothetical protein
MKKRGVKRTKHPKHSRKNCKFFFTPKKLFIVGVALFLVFAFLLTVTSVPQNVTYTGHPMAETNFISEFFTKWNTGNLDINISKYLFWITIMLLIFSALKFANFPSFPKADGKSGGGFLQFILALVVSFLATAFITPEEVFVMLTSYSALGLTLGSILPFVIIMFFSAMLVSNESIRGMSIGKMMLEVVIWFMWVGFLVYRFIKLWATEGTINVLFKGGGIVMLVVFFLSLLILIFNKKFRQWIQNLGIELIKSRERAISAGRQAEQESRRAEHSARE